MKPANWEGFNPAFFILLLCFTLLACKHYYRNHSHSEVSSSSIEKGEILAKKYCQSCHSFPDPSLVDAKSWEKGVLPNMGPRLGIFSYHLQTYPSNRYDRYLEPGYYPSRPIIDSSDWQHILDYYEATSPDSLPGQKRQYALQTGLALFSAERPLLQYQNATTSLVRINPDPVHALMVSDAFRQTSYFFNRQMQSVDSVFNGGSLVDINKVDSHFVACDIGVLNPNNGKFGKGQILRFGQDGKMHQDKASIFDSLQRPVQITAADLNKDGKTDYIICEFGFLTGAFSWMENLGNGKFEKHILRHVPGAIKAYVTDYNHDGLPDIWVLFAQGDECIYLYTNKGNGKFDETRLLSFPPIYGSSYFELADFNHDGYMDIIYTCGDNADYSAVLKPYHGVYIFMNDGNNHFTQKYFFPINGCYKAIARDFDGDGDLDIATISFFADYVHQPAEGFIYLQNDGNLDFHPFTLPEGASGHWLTMDAGDIYGNGKTDLVLGNFCIGPVIARSGYDWKKAGPFLILRNTGKVNTFKPHY